MNFKTDNEVWNPTLGYEELLRQHHFPSRDNTRSARACTNILLRPGCHRHCSRTELSVRLPLSKIRYQNPSYNHSKPRRIPNVNLLTEGNLRGSFVFPSVKMCYKDTAMLLTLSFHCSREHGVGTACISAFCGSHRLHTGSATHKMDTLTHLGTVCCKCWLITPHRYLEDVFLQLQNGASL